MCPFVRRQNTASTARQRLPWPHTARAHLVRKLLMLRLLGQATPAAYSALGSTKADTRCARASRWSLRPDILSRISSQAFSVRSIRPLHLRFVKDTKAPRCRSSMTRGMGSSLTMQVVASCARRLRLVAHTPDLGALIFIPVGSQNRWVCASTILMCRASFAVAPKSSA